MKTCRFCNFQQENGDRCDACGSPFSADKVDFSEGLPDLMGGSDTFPDPTASSFPDPTAPVKPSSEPVVPVVASGTSEKASASDAKAPAPSEIPPILKPKETAPVEKEAPKPQRKVMYSAAASGETVYKKSKGGYHPQSSAAEPFDPSLSTKEDAPMEQPGPGWWNGAPNSGTSSADTASATPAPAVVPVLNTAAPVSDFSKYSGTYTHSLVTFIISCVGLLCLCGMSTPSLVLSLIAFTSLQPMKNGARADDPEKIASRAKKLTLIADFLLVAAAFVLFLAILLS